MVLKMAQMLFIKLPLAVLMRKICSDAHGGAGKPLEYKSQCGRQIETEGQCKEIYVLHSP
jgi:hypothetical protein